MPDISVIVPVYNVEWYLEECLDSLVSQTCRNIEFICLDDGSTDRSPQILERYAGRDKRIRVIHKENEGYGKTMNKGLELATSPWIGIVESDDFIRADMFEKLYAAAAGSQADIIKCNFYKYKTREGKDTEYSREYPEYLFEKEICPAFGPGYTGKTSWIKTAYGFGRHRGLLPGHFLSFPCPFRCGKDKTHKRRPAILPLGQSGLIRLQPG